MACTHKVVIPVPQNESATNKPLNRAQHSKILGDSTAPKHRSDRCKVRVIMNAIDTSNYHIEGNKSNVKLVSSLTVDSALLTAPYFLCCTEPQTVGSPHWLAALCRLAPSCCMLCCALVNLCKETNTWHCTKKPNAAFANIQVVKVKVFSCCAVCCPNRNTLDISCSSALPLQLDAPSAHWEH